MATHKVTTPPPAPESQQWSDQPVAGTPPVSQQWSTQIGHVAHVEPEHWAAPAHVEAADPPRVDRPSIEADDVDQVEDVGGPPISPAIDTEQNPPATKAKPKTPKPRS